MSDILGDQLPKTSSLPPVPLTNNEAISNSSSPIENEKLRKKIEIQQNLDRVELKVELTEEQRLQQEALSFGETKAPVSASKTKA